MTCMNRVESHTQLNGEKLRQRSLSEEELVS